LNNSSKITKKIKKEIIGNISMIDNRRRKIKLYIRYN